jgi:hypothetical protein
MNYSPQLSEPSRDRKGQRGASTDYSAGFYKLLLTHADTSSKSNVETVLKIAQIFLALVPPSQRTHVRWSQRNPGAPQMCPKGMLRIKFVVGG